mgnify:CR=1 FL=1
MSSSFIDMKDIGIQAVSHSRMKTHEGCPRKAMYKFVEKIKEPGNDAMNRGLEVHSGYEHWLLKHTGKPTDGKDGMLPVFPISSVIEKDVKEYWDLPRAERYDIQAEQQVAFDKDWNVTSWFGPDAWMRVVFDSAFTSPNKEHIVLNDYKTGKVYDDHDDQAELYAVAGRKMGAKKVNVKFYYMDQNTVQPYKFDENELDALVDKIEARALKVTSDRLFPTKPSWKCKWCFFSKQKGGKCAH